ncbi:alpha/beta hydrolase [uncultured Prochlorococcus sp.]|jgi:hypothetical protein|uniref:alpha/beta hydrolase n=1 Tax=Prochlorococcus sp. TaxID=1220 RepID=UPI000DF965B3|nr:alpha/beta hydrolase [uncultured Prochlorococcus sp.]RCL50689.1 MAG: alpha/beta hydrolase [Prochlorococcus sp. MED-G72]
MKFSKSLIPRIFLILFINQIFFNVPKAQSAEKIKIIYSIFSRTITVDSLKTFAESGNSSKSLRKILNATGSSDEKIQSILNNKFEIPITIASKLVYSEIGNVFLNRLSSILHTPNTNDERTGRLALRSSVIQGLYTGNGKIDLVSFFKSYPTKTVILNVNALSKVMNKVQSISELLDFFTSKPLEKIKTIK